MEPHRVEAYFSLIWRAALQDAMADLAHEANRARQTDSAEVMWRLVRRCRERALKLRAEADAVRTRKQ